MNSADGARARATVTGLTQRSCAPSARDGVMSLRRARGKAAMKTCPDCGERVYNLGCVNCNEEAYIEEQNMLTDAQYPDEMPAASRGETPEPVAEGNG